MVFSLNSLKYSKNFVIQILCSYHKSSSIHNNIYHLSFVQISIFFLLITILISINKFKCPIGFNFLRFSISFLNIIQRYLTSFFKKKIYIYIYTVIYISLLIIITLNQKKKKSIIALSKCV